MRVRWYKRVGTRTLGIPRVAGGGEDVGAGGEVTSYSSATTTDPLSAVREAVLSGRAGPTVAGANSLGFAAPALAAIDGSDDH